MSESNLVHTHSYEEGFVKITLNRPEKRNALTLDMYRRLSSALADCADNDACHAVIICGAEGHFCSGNDLHDFSATQMRDDVFAVVSHFMTTILRFPKPIIAAVQGRAVGIGATLLLHCDMVIASASAEFQFPFIDLGLCPEFASSILLTERVGHHKAMEWLMLGEVISAESALAHGLLNHLHECPIDRALEYGSTLAGKPLRALMVTKALAKQHRQHDLMRAIDRECARFAEALSQEEFRIATNRFFSRGH